jgi:DNA-binding MarR family transcriptional regulator
MAPPGEAGGARLADVTRIAAALDAAGRLMRRSVWAQARRLPVPLTPPQLLALKTLVDSARERPEAAGLSLSELSRRMGLAHSTASGIVDRLERQGLVVRTPRPEDRRYVDIELAASVRDWLEHELPGRRNEPLVRALLGATDEEWTAVLNGCLTLERLLVEGGATDGTPGR